MPGKGIEENNLILPAFLFGTQKLSRTNNDSFLEHSLKTGFILKCNKTKNKNKKLN